MRKLKAKMGFFDLAKHGLNKHGFKDQNWSHVLGEERNRRERRAKEEKKRKRKKKKKRSQASQGMELWIFGMETNLDYEFYEIWHVSLGLYDDYFAQT